MAPSGQEAVLWHIEISHYNEKARWALDLKRVPHRRRAPLPGVLHPIVALAKSRKPTLPVLELEGRTIGDSTRIIEELERRFSDPPLYPADPAQRARALELEDWFDEEVAPQVRRWLFYEISLEPGLSAKAMRMFGTPLPAPAAALMIRGSARRYGGKPAVLERAREATRAGFERVEAELQPSGYLVGDSFSVADLTAASILMHLPRPPEFQYGFPEFPKPVDEYFATFPPGAVEYVRRMWREHRPPSAEIVADAAA
jgi:glutathione S-transferase